MSAPSIEIVNVTPALAAQWLIGHNRHLRPSVWQRYARDMAAGNWQMNGETIKRTTQGETIDGQHRLKAIVETGCTVPMVVVADLPPQAQETVDRGLPRNIPDALRLRGEKDVNNLAAAISQVIVMQSSAPTTSDFWPSTTEALEFLESHPSIREACQVGGRVRKALRTPSSTAGAVWFLAQEIDSDDADAFFNALIEGANLPSDSPILRLREFMFREMSAPRRVGRTRLQAYYLKAWNAWREGRPMSQLKWKVGGSEPEKFPVAA